MEVQNKNIELFSKTTSKKMPRYKRYPNFLTNLDASLAGRIVVSLITENGRSVSLSIKDIWPNNTEIEELIDAHVHKELFKKEYGTIFAGNDLWKNLTIADESTFRWDNNSNHIKNPPYFEGFAKKASPPDDITHARALLFLGNSVTTDHISPAGAIPRSYPAGEYLLKEGVLEESFNSYGSRRGNHEVMLRGTFGNIRLKNHLVTSRERSFTRKFPEDTEMYIYEAAMKYQVENALSESLVK